MHPHCFPTPATDSPHYIIGIAMGSGIFGLFMLCEGFFILRDDIPPYWIGAYYAAFHTCVATVLKVEVAALTLLVARCWATGPSPAALLHTHADIISRIA